MVGDKMRSQEEVEKWIYKQKQKVKAYIENNNYYSVMNNTKWLELINGVKNELPFTPPYVLKTLFEDEDMSLSFEADVDYLGAWNDEALCWGQYYLIEWIKVRPRYVKNIGGRLVSKEQVIDEEQEFISLLCKYNIPYEVKNGMYIIYGYRQN